MCFIRIKMPRLCVHCGVNPIFSHGHCTWCQGFRDDPDYLDKKAKRIVKARSPIKAVSKHKAKEIVDLKRSDEAFYQEVWDNRCRVCENCGVGLGNEPNMTFFHHLCPKAKYPQLRHIEENIALLCFSCHSEVHSAKPPIKIIKRQLELIEQYTKQGRL